MARAGKGGGNVEKVATAGVTRSLVTYILLIKMVMLQDHLWPESERNRIYS